MTKRHLIYAENKTSAPREYQITPEILGSALAGSPHQFDFVIAETANPDIEALKAAEFMIGAGFHTARIAKWGRRLRLVHCTSAGVESYLPLDWLPTGAVLTNSSGVHARKGGAYGAMAVLMLNERIPRHASNQRLRRWDESLNTGIAGKTVLIHGFGSLGEAIARYLKPFGVRILGTRRSGQPHPLADAIVSPDRLQEVLPQAHFLVVACPLTKETRGQIGADQLALLPRGAGLLNISRGAVVDGKALAENLASGHLSGAVLDVFETEPLPEDSFWWDVSNLIITPHTSCDDSENYVESCTEIFVANVKSILDGEKPRNVVSQELEY